MKLYFLTRHNNSDGDWIFYGITDIYKVVVGRLTPTTPPEVRCTIVNDTREAHQHIDAMKANGCTHLVTYTIDTADSNIDIDSAIIIATKQIATSDLMVYLLRDKIQYVVTNMKARRDRGLDSKARNNCISALDTVLYYIDDLYQTIPYP